MTVVQQVLSIVVLMMALNAGLPVAAEQLSDLDQVAEAFAQRPQLDELVKDNRPLLDQAYPLVVEDYYQHVGQYEPLPKPEAHQVQSCADHYAGVWLGQRLWWPTHEDGTPDWQTIYVHILDHYIGYCLRNTGFEYQRSAN